MIKFPAEAFDTVFRNALKRGAIILTEKEFEDISKPKFFITLNKDPSLDDIYFFTTTSKTDFYNKHPRFESDIIRIQAGEISCFNIETIIICREVHSFAKNELMKRFREGKLKFKDNLPNNILIKLDEIIRRSKLLSKNIKRIICP
ncbi:MAG: hypothetical protein ACETWC_07820 [Acidobacteriota bacterium]